MHFQIDGQTWVSGLSCPDGKGWKLGPFEWKKGKLGRIGPANLSWASMFE